MYDFEYLRPETIEEALRLYGKGNGEIRLLAGGTELVNEIRFGKSKPERIIDLKSIYEMDFIEIKREVLRIGALYRVRDAERSKTLMESGYNVLGHAAGTLGSPQVRNKATIVGNVCRASPSADLIPPLIALNAIVKIVSEGGVRKLAVEDMLIGPGKTLIEKGEIVTEIEIEGLQNYTGCSYYKMSPRKSLDLAVVGVAAMMRTDKDISMCCDAKIVLGAVAPTAIRAKKAEEILIGAELGKSKIEEAAKTAAEESRPIDDVRASAWYRKRMIEVLVKRTIEDALDQIRKRGGFKNGKNYHPEYK